MIFPHELHKLYYIENLRHKAAEQEYNIISRMAKNRQSNSQFLFNSQRIFIFCISYINKDENMRYNMLYGFSVFLGIVVKKVRLLTEIHKRSNSLLLCTVHTNMWAKARPSQAMRAVQLNKNMIHNHNDGTAQSNNKKNRIGFFGRR